MNGRRRTALTGGGLGSLSLIAAAALASLGGSPGSETPATVLQLLDVGAVLWVGTMVFARRPDNPVGPVLLTGGLLASLLLLFTYYTNYSLLIDARVPGGVVALIGQQLLWPLVYFFLFALLPLLFPDGRFLSTRWRWLAVGLLTLCLVAAVVGPLQADLPLGTGNIRNPIGLIDPSVLDAIVLPWTMLFSIGTLAAFGSLLLRFRRSDSEGREQLRWVAAAVGLTLVVLALQQFSMLLAPALALPDWAFLIPLAGLPASIGLAVVRHRLFDIDLVIRRSMVYGVLWLAIVVVYAGLAGMLGLAAGSMLSLQAAILVTIGATILFQPARTRLERLADRLVFGRRAGAYEVVRDFGAATERTLDVNEIGPRLADAARTGIGARWARVIVREGPRDEKGTVLGSSGDVSGSAALVAPLVRGAEEVGTIECGPRPDGAYGPRDREVLFTLGRQAALAIQNAGLTAELVRRIAAMDEQARALAASRHRLVEAQETERRRIERDVHDGVQQQLISLVAGIRLARNRLQHDPAGVEAHLRDVQGQALGAVKELRDLVRGIHPPVLADAGLVPAVETMIAGLPLTVTLEVDAAEASRLAPAHIESAAYFVISEALTNVMKHAGVDTATVRAQRRNGVLTVWVSDRGCGFIGADGEGSGLAGLRDRVAAVGGELAIVSELGRGTTVTAILPGGPA